MLSAADGDHLTCKDIGRESDSMISLTLIFRNFHRRNRGRICRGNCRSFPAADEAEHRQT
jgi:hypothetical protein